MTMLRRLSTLLSARTSSAADVPNSEATNPASSPSANGENPPPNGPTPASRAAEANESPRAKAPSPSEMITALTTLTFGPRNAFPLYVPVSDLYNATDTGLSKLKSRTLSRLRRRVHVEALDHSRSDNVFFAPLPVTPADSAAVPTATTFTTVAPVHDTPHLVLASDDFEVALVGMHSVSHDGPFGKGDELLLYSVRDAHEASERKQRQRMAEQRRLSALAARDRIAGASADAVHADLAVGTGGAGHSEEFHRSGHWSGRDVSEQITRDTPSSSATSSYRYSHDDDSDHERRRRRHRTRRQRHRDSHRNRRRYSRSSPNTKETGEDSTDTDDAHARPSALLQSGEEAKIHFDPVVDGHDQGTAPNTYQTVPGRKGLVLQHRGASGSARADTVHVRFTVVEVDAVTDVQRRGVQKAGEVLTGTVGAVPFGKFVAPALGGVSTIANSALDRFEMPDHVMSRDVMFRLLAKFPPPATETNALRTVPADTVSGSLSESGDGRRLVYADNYLRYGFYFFLAHKVDAKLYAQTDTSSTTVPLMLRRTGRRGNKDRLGEREFFPMTGVSYVVMKVTPGCLTGRVDRTKRQQQLDHARLEEILNMKKAMELLGTRSKA